MKCIVKIKWKFGTIVIDLAEEQAEYWRFNLSNCFQGIQSVKTWIDENNATATGCDALNNINGKANANENPAGTSAHINYDSSSTIESSQTERSSNHQQDLRRNSVIDECKNDGENFLQELFDNVVLSRKVIELYWRISSIIEFKVDKFGPHWEA